MARDSSGDNENSGADDHPHLDRDTFPQSKRANQALRGWGAHWMEMMAAGDTACNPRLEPPSYSGESGRIIERHMCATGLLS